MLIVSDFDGTLTMGETWRGITAFVGEQGRQSAVRRFLFPRITGLLLSRLGIGDNLKRRVRFMEQLPALIRQYSESQVAAMAEWVVEHELWPKRRQAMLDELAQHRAANKRVVVASGAYQPVLAAFCARLDVECIGTPLEMRDGRLTGRLSGPLNVADTKAASITRLTAGQPIEMAYGDTVQDLPLLKLAKTPVAVNPEPKLRALALAHGWRIIEDAG